jgi:gamma-glutamyltranspeptidase/glutathione hydrolase
VQTDLADTIEMMIAAEGAARRRGRVRAIRAARDVFYKGEIARRIADHHTREGGLMAYEDLAAFEVEVAPALKTAFRYESRRAVSGAGAGVPQMLSLIELRLRGSATAPRGAHCLVRREARVRRPRAHYGDPQHVKVPAAVPRVRRARRA